MAKIIQFPGARVESAERPWTDEDVLIVLYSALAVSTAGETVRQANRWLTGDRELSDFAEPFAALFGVKLFDADTRLWPLGADTVPERLASSVFAFEMSRTIRENHRIKVQPRNVTITPVVENGELVIRLSGENGADHINVNDFAWAWPTVNTACSAMRMNVLRYCGNLALTVRLVLPDVLR